MKKILVPVDFSTNSLKALRMALETAISGKLEVIVTHQLSLLELTADTTFTGFYIPVATDQLAYAKKELERFVKKATSSFKSSGAEKLITQEVVPGASATDIIIERSKKHKADLIVMGTNGASGLKRLVIGSVAATVLEKSSIPVMVIPNNYRRKVISKIGYASDLAHTENELKKLLPIASLFNASIEMFHVEPTFPTSAHYLKFKAEQDIPTLKNKLKLPSLGYKMVKTKFDNDFFGGVHKYVQKEKPGLICMVNHKRSWIGKILDPSKSKGLAYHTEVPVISIKA